jgi:hypothetical protein
VTEVESELTTGDDSGEAVTAASEAGRDPLLPAILLVVALVVAGAFAWIALFANESRSADADPQFARLIGERTSRLGGTYYQNALHNKGPLEAFLYHLPREILGFDAYWYGISFFILIGTCILSFAVGRVTLVHPVPRAAGVATGVIAFFHFALARADYSGVLYSRNVTSYMLAAVWIIVLLPGCWTPRRSLASVAAIGFLFGLASQTLLSAAIECVVLVVLVAWVVRERVEDRLVRRHLVVGAISGVLTFVSAGVWYVLRGSFDEFWAGWWTYAGFQSSATSLTMVDKFQRGWNAMTKYYGDFPLSLMIVVGFVGLTWLCWKQLARFQRVVHLTAFGWLLAGWLELVLSWRYSSHYFSVIAVPTTFIGALLVGHGLTLVAKVRPLRFSLALPVLALGFCFVHFRDNRVSAGVDAIRNYQSPAELTAGRRAADDGPFRTVRAILDVVSHDDDPLLAWTNSSWPYLDFRRVPASRMAWYTFFQGNIYLGETGPEWVLPQTWRWFAEDMAQTDPVAEWERKDTPHDPDLPFAAYIDEHMSPRYDGSKDTVYLRNDVAALLTDDTGLDPIAVPAKPAGAERIDIGEGRCRAVSMTVEGDTTGLMATFHLGGTALPDRTLGAHQVGVSGKADGEEFDRAGLPDAAGGRRHLRVVVGDRSALLVVDGVIGGAVELTAASPTLSMVIDQEGLTISDAKAGPVTWPANC